MKKIVMANVEQETIIIWNRAEDSAFIFTYEPTWQKHLQSLGCRLVSDNGCGGKEYEIDKKRIPKPRAKRKMTEENRAALSERLSKLRPRKRSTVSAPSKEGVVETHAPAKKPARNTAAV